MGFLLLFLLTAKRFNASCSVTLDQTGIPKWGLLDTTCTDGEAVYSHCGMSPPCDGDDNGIDGNSWCLIETSENCAPSGTNWDYCIVGLGTLCYSMLTIPMRLYHDKLFLFLSHQEGVFSSMISVFCNSTST